MSAPVATPATDAERRGPALLAICAAAFLVFLDTTIVNIAFPDLRADFDGATTDQLVWVLDGYFIAVAALLVPAGGIADYYGRKRLLLWGLAAFAVTSLACAAAPSWQVLAIARVIQGLAGAVLVPASLALLLDLYPDDQRATGVGLWGAAAALAAAVGPVLGGALVEFAGWRWIFLVNLPLVALAIWAGARALRESRDEAADGVPELLGSVLIAAALGLLALALVRGNDWGWAATPTVASFAGAAVATVGAVLRAARHPRPAVDLGLLRIQSFRLGTLGTALFAMSFFSIILGNVLFLTEIWGYSVFHAGLAAAPGPLASTLVAAPAGRLADRLGARAVIVPGTLIYAVGVLVLRDVPADGSYVTDWLPGQLMTGVGIGLAFPTLGAAAAQEVGARQFASAAAVTSAARQVGAVIGTAVLVAFAGHATTFDTAMQAFDDSYLVAAIGAVLAGIVCLRLGRPRATSDPATAVTPAEAGA